MRRIVRRAATSNAPVSKIWLPMWEWMPSSSMCGLDWHRTSAMSAWPPWMEKPNFWSSCAVAMYSWVWASMPVVTRTSTLAVTPSSVVSASMRAISSSESTMIRPTPDSRASRSSSTVLLLPCRPILAGSIPPRSATTSSLPLHTSRPSPSSAIHDAIRVERKDLPA